MRIDIVKLSIDDFIMTRVRRTYIKDFKLQMGKLYENGKSRNKVIREYDLTLSTFSNWIKQHQIMGHSIIKTT
ncbi:transposase [Staphylococcus argenteus]|uniref:transposase n=2 Tax=Staphylococcus argenteus TaxID=985002 RepID=UPI001FB955F3|nr:transposase [Staphylococcus argenteus]